MSELTHVRLVGIPVELMGRSNQHQQELLREFALIQLSDKATKADLPARLLEVVERYRQEFSKLAVRTRGEFAQARERRQPYVDLELDLPRGAPQAARELRTLFDEADDFCRRGDLITLASPPEFVAFRHWFLDEIIRQCEGDSPVAFEDADAV